MKRKCPYKNLGEYVKACSRQFPEHVAMQIRRGFAVERYTYAQMYDLMSRWASYLQHIGVRKGDMILIWGPNMPEWTVALVGTLMAGAVAVPVSMHATRETVDEYIRQTKAKYCIRSKFISDKERSMTKIIEMEDVVALARTASVSKLPVVLQDDLAEIMYTSGTTGDPSGVMLTHGNILEGVTGLQVLMPPANEYRMLSILPLSHALEQLAGFFTAIHFGATLYYLARINPVVILRSLNHYRITHIIAVPELLKVMWNSIEFQAQQRGSYEKLQSGLKIAQYLPMRVRRFLFRDIHRVFGGKLRMFACAGAPLDRWVGENWEKIGVVVLEGYGLTETSAALTANQIEARKIGSVGKLVSGVEVKFSDDGEVMTRGLNVTPGYYKNPKKTRESFTEDGYFKTGDIGYVAKDGFVYLTGRKKFKIVTPTGEKVYPEDVERTLNDNPAVKESCVVGIKKDIGEVVHASLILKRDIDPELVIAQVNGVLESHQTILEWSLWPDEDFPRTRSLKKDRNKVKAHIMGLKETGDEEEVQNRSSDLPARDPVADILSVVSSVEKTKITDDMQLVFDLHLDSLRRVALISMIEEEFGVTLEEEDIDEKTTVKKLRKLVSHGKKTVIENRLPTWPVDPVIVTLRDIVRTYFVFPLAKLLMARISIENKDVLRSMTSSSIIVFNHVGHLEPMMIMASLPRSVQRRLVTLADSEGFYVWYRRIFLYFIACAFPIEKRGGPVRQTLEFAADLLENRWSLMMSPEGNRSTDGKMLPFRHGTSVIAIETGVPVYPVKVKGYQEAHWMREKGVFDIFFDFAKPGGKVTLVFGEPLVFSGTTSYEDATEKIREAIEAL